MFNRTLGRVGDYRRGITIGIILLLAIAVTTHHMGSAPPGLSPAEAASKAQSASLRYIIDHPLDAPHKLVMFAAQKISPRRIGVLRLSSYIYALVFSAAFYYLARGWFGKTVGLLGSLVYCLSPFILVPARVASAEIMLAWPIGLMAAYYWFDKTDKKTLGWMTLILVAGLAIYSPGLIWWIAGAAILCRKKLLAFINQLPRPLAGAGLGLLLILLIPAGLAVFRDWHFLESLAALPSHWPAPLRLAKNLVWMILSLAVKTPHHAQLMIGRLPLLDLIQLGLLVFGIYAMWTAAKAKTIAFGLSVLLAVVLAAINDNIMFLLLGLPAIGILMAAGLRYLYIEWRSVFPRNPIPKSLAVALMSVLVGIQLAYGLSYSLIAWPHSPDTKAVYVLK